MKKIGLLGGTFDPVHNGHVEIARSFIESGFIDDLWILLTPFPPHKLKSKHVPYEIRLKMLKKGFDDLDCRILTIENELPKPSYTYRTIQVLKEQHPGYKFYFCMGEDSLSQFHTWKHYTDILDEADLLVANRPSSNHQHVEPLVLEQTSFVNHSPIQISSSDIRDRIEDSEFIQSNLDSDVISIIEKENLYR